MLRLEHLPTRGFLSDLTTEQQESVRHLLACPECRQAAENSLLPARPGGGPAPQSSYQRVFSSHEDGLGRILRGLSGDRERAEALFDELMVVPERQRLRAVSREPGFRTPDLAEHLLRLAESELEGNPEGCEELAGLALAIAMRLPVGDPLGRGSAAAALAGCLCAEARRRRGHWRAASTAYEEAARYLNCGLEDELRAYFCVGLAKLRWKERRVDEAAALLERAAGVYAANQQDQLEGMCRALQGFLYLELREATCAFVPLARAHELLDPAAAPALAVRTTLGSAFCHAAMGWAAGAEELTAAARELAAPVEDPAERICRQWWEGSIAARCGHCQSAQAMLLAVRRHLLEHGSLREAALATLDLVVAKLACGERDGIGELGHELLHAFAQHVPFRIAAAIGLLERLPPEDVGGAIDLVQSHLYELPAPRRGRRDLIRHVIDLAALPAG